jgi:hypothetical protein
LSSTTEARRRAHGQVIVIFAIFLTVLMGAAALALDVGMALLEQRTQQNAADAAALAGARHLPANFGPSEGQARALATANGYTDGVADVGVEVTFPTRSQIEVCISNSRAPLFAQLFGINSWDIEARAVAINGTLSGGGFAMMALDEEACGAMLVEGQGTVVSYGNIQVNSGCDEGEGAFRVAGSGSLSLIGDDIGCNVVGDASYGGGVLRNDCRPANTDADLVPDPYADLPDPPVPDFPARPVNVNDPDALPPAGCPGSDTPATDEAPLTCTFGGVYNGQTWRLYPGYYPGGINLEGGTFYLEPGIYYIAGGGFRTAGGSVSVTSVATNGSALDRGIMIFNTDHPHPLMDAASIVLQGGNSEISLWPVQNTAYWDGFLIFQARHVTEPVYIVGGGSTLDARGVIYAPGAEIIVEANGGTVTVDQLLGNTISVKGNVGTITVAYDDSFVPSVRMAGLIE